MVGLNTLLMTLMLWVSQSMGVIVPTEFPVVQYATSQEMTCMLAGQDPAECDIVLGKDDSKVLALYNPSSRVLLLQEGRDYTTPASISIIVHELVHHIQTANGLTYSCLGKLERAAYDTQIKWLEAHGFDAYELLEKDLKLDRMAIFFITVCYDK